jgi:hypothetical protein
MSSEKEAAPVTGDAAAPAATAAAKDASSDKADSATAEEAVPDMSLLDITEGVNERGIPAAKFIDDVDVFASSFDPPASAELLIGAYTQLFNKYKTFEGNLTNRRKWQCIINYISTSSL